MKPLRFFLTALAAVAVVFFLPNIVTFARNLAPIITSAPQEESASEESAPVTTNSSNRPQTNFGGKPHFDQAAINSANPSKPQNPKAASMANQPLVFGESGPVTLEQIPPGRFRKQLLSLQESARQAALKRLGDERVPIFDVYSLHVDGDGMLFYTCPPAPDADQQNFPQAPVPSLAPVPISSPPARSSKPGATSVIYLDFNGHTVTGTAWNSSGRASFQCLPFDLDNNTTTFSDTEQAMIIEVWERVAEDFKAFNVNVTTVEPETFSPSVARALITRNTDATGANNPSSTAGGVAYKSVFGLQNFHTSYSPAFAYHNRLGNVASSIAECVSHEIGHNLGLSHDGGASGEYYSGHGTGEASWGPIMGASYHKNFTQWSKGDYVKANNKEDDIAIIAAKTGYAADDVPANLVGANSINVTSGTFLSENHIIGAQTDVDIHRIEITQNAVTINAEAFKVPGALSYGSNLGIQLELLSSAGNLVAAAASPGQSTATITASVPTGTYFIRIAGTGNGNPLATSPTGFNSYGSMGAYKIYGTIGSGGGSFAPVVSTGNATSTTLNATTLSAAVNPRGLSTGVFFQYGTSGSFGLNSASQSVGSGSSNTTISARLTGLLPSTTYYYRAVAQNSGGTSYGDTQSFTTISNSTVLQSLTLSNGTLSPTFSSATRNYTVSVSHETSSLSASWATLHSSAVAQVRFNTGNFSSTLGGTNSGNFALAVGNNTISIRVTAQDGTTSGNYTIRAVRARSSDTTLSSLSLAAGAFSPVFSTSTSNYSLSIPNSISATSINATKVTAGGKIEARVGSGAFVALKSGVASSALKLAPGVNLLEVKVTADNGTATRSYFFSINRAASGTLLSNLIPRWNTSNFTLSPAFSSNTTTYSLTVANAVSSLTLLPTLLEKNSTAAARVGSGNFTAITADKPSSLPLQTGTNSVQLRVLSDDKVTSRVYSLAVNRLTAPVSHSVGSVTLNGTTLSGMIDARSTAAAFQIGTTSSFGTSLPLSFVSGNGTAVVSTSTGALQASTLYYFRIRSQYGGITDNGTTGSFLTPVRTSLTPFFRTGGNATGLVPGATFAGFGNPTMNIEGDAAFNATAAFSGSNSTNNAGIWTVVGGTPRLIARIGSNATGGGVFSALGEPVLDNNRRTTFIGSLRVGVGGVATANATGIWRAAANGTLSLVAKAGAAAPGATGTIFKSFNNLVAGEGGIAFTATLASGSSNVTTSNNTGLWAQNGSGNLVLVARTGASPTPTLSSFSLFNSEAGQTGQSRHFNDAGDLLLLARFGTAPQGIYRARAYSFTLNGAAPVAAVGSAVPNVAGAVFSAISNPILSQSGEVAFKGTFTGNGVTTANNTGLFVYPSSGNGSLLVRTGVADGVGRVFQAISSPLLNGAGNLAFTGTLKTGVGGVSTANATGVWMVSPEGDISTIARAGESAPGLSGARFASFSQIACPDEAGVAFVATLAAGGGGVTTSNNMGLWATPAPGEEPVLVIRIGDSFSVGGVAKTVSAIGIFSASANTAGAGRSFNAFGDLIFKLTFTDKTSGLFTYP